MASHKPSTEGEMGSGDSDDEFYNVKLPSTPVLPEIKKQPVKKVYSPSRTKVTYDYKFDSSSDSEAEEPKPKEKSPPKEPDPNVFTPVPKKQDSIIENTKISQSTSQVVQKINDELKSMKNKKPEIDQQINVAANIPTVSSQPMGMAPAAVIMPQTIVGPANQPVTPMGPQGMMVPAQMGMIPGNMIGNMMTGPGPMGGMMGVAPMGPQGNMMGMQNNMMPMQNAMMMPNMMGMMGAQPNMMMGNMMGMQNPNMMAPMMGMQNPNMMGNPNLMLPGNMMGNPNPMLNNPNLINPNMMNNPAGPMGSATNIVNNPGGIVINPNPNTPNRMFNPGNNPVGNQIRVRNPPPVVRPPVSFRPRTNDFKWRNNKIPPRGFSPNNIRLSSNASFDKKELRYVPLDSEQSERRDSDTGSTRSSSPGSDVQSPVELPNNFKNDGSFMEMFKKMKDEGSEREGKKLL